jgi:membrane fusion protein (multidrug efflux system)
LGIEHKEEALLMPLEALVMEKTNAFAYTVQDNKAVKRPIKVGFTDARNAEVLEGVGLNDAVILAGQLKLTDGDPVRVVAAP